MAQTEGAGATVITVSVPLLVWARSTASSNACSACGEPSKAKRSRRNISVLFEYAERRAACRHVSQPEPDFAQDELGRPRREATRSTEVVEPGKDVTERGICRLDRKALARSGREVDACASQ